METAGRIPLSKGPLSAVASDSKHGTALTHSVHSTLQITCAVPDKTARGFAITLQKTDIQHRLGVRESWCGYRLSRTAGSSRSLAGLASPEQSLPKALKKALACLLSWEQAR
jgi:hypothetical protein